MSNRCILADVLVGDQSPDKGRGERNGQTEQMLGSYKAKGSQVLTLRFPSVRDGNCCLIRGGNS